MTLQGVEVNVWYLVELSLQVVQDQKDQDFVDNR